MPIEIRELVIHTEITDPGQNEKRQGLSEQDLAAMKAQIIKECMEMLHEQQTRMKER